jgi:sedoheptulokinase
MYFTGIDIGTSSISSVVYNPLSGQADYDTRINNTSLESSDDWEKRQDPDKIMNMAKEILDASLKKYPDIKGIGITGQMHGILYIDNRGKAISPLYTWQDGRANRIYRANKTYATFLSDITGHELATGYGLVTHFYNQVNHLVPEGAAKICTIMDYVVMKLAGNKKPVTDSSNAASLGFFDVQNGRFDHPALDKAGIDATLIPELCSPVFCPGNYKGIPVYPAIGDNQAAFLGSVQDIHRSIHITVGTSSQVSVYSDKYIKIPGLDTRPFPGGGFTLVGAALCGGQAFSMLNVFFEKTLKMFMGKKTEHTDIYHYMTSVPYVDNTQDIPVVTTLFDGTRFAPGERGCIENISIHNFTPENLIIGFLKGICRELYHFYDNLPEEIKKEKKNLIGSGNALKKNPLLCKAFEEQFDHRLSFSSGREEAAFGACLISIKNK